MPGALQESAITRDPITGVRKEVWRDGRGRVEGRFGFFADADCAGARAGN